MLHFIFFPVILLLLNPQFSTKYISFPASLFKIKKINYISNVQKDYQQINIFIISQIQIQMDMQQEEHLMKIVLVGASTTGKSWILQQYMKQKVNTNSQPTIGVEFATKIIQVQDKTVKLQIWDTAGQERYKSITQAHFRKSHGAILVYNITQEKSFLQVQEQIQIVKDLTDPDCVLMLVGNYLDLVEKNPIQRQVSLEMAQGLASSNNMMFMEVCAKSGQNIEQIFTQLVTQIMQTMERQDKVKEEQIQQQQVEQN